MSIYLDNHTTYKSHRKLTIEEELAGVSRPLSQFERALDELGIEVIHAHSPQAKGRIERLFGVLQVRLVKEMRLRGIKTKDEANAFLWEYLPTYNRRFRVTPANKTDVHVKPERYFNPVRQTGGMDRYLCIRTERTVRNDPPEADWAQRQTLSAQGKGHVSEGYRGREAHLSARQAGWFILSAVVELV